MEAITFEQLPKAVSQLCADMEFVKQHLLLSSTSVSPEVDKLLTIRQAADILTLSVPTIYGLVSRSEIPCMKKGKRLYFSKQELTEWIKTGRKKTAAEIAREAGIYLQGKKRG